MGCRAVQECGGYFGLSAAVGVVTGSKDKVLHKIPGERASWLAISLIRVAACSQTGVVLVCSVLAYLLTSCSLVTLLVTSHLWMDRVS